MNRLTLRAFLGAVLIGITVVEALFTIALFLANAFFVFFGRREWNGASMWYPASWRLVWLPVVALIAAWLLYRKAGQAVGIKEVHDDIWLVSFMDYDLGYFDLETRVLEPLENPFGPKVLPMS